MFIRNMDSVRSVRKKAIATPLSNRTNRTIKLRDINEYSSTNSSLVEKRPSTNRTVRKRTRNSFCFPPVNDIDESIQHCEDGKENVPLPCKIMTVDSKYDCEVRLPNLTMKEVAEIKSNLKNRKSVSARMRQQRKSSNSTQEPSSSKGNPRRSTKRGSTLTPPKSTVSSMRKASTNQQTANGNTKSLDQSQYPDFHIRDGSTIDSESETGISLNNSTFNHGNDMLLPNTPNSSENIDQVSKAEKRKSKTTAELNSKRSRKTWSESIDSKAEKRKSKTTPKSDNKSSRKTPPTSGKKPRKKWLIRMDFKKMLTPISVPLGVSTPITEKNNLGYTSIEGVNGDTSTIGIQAFEEPGQSPIISTAMVEKTDLPNSSLEGVNRGTSSIGIQVFEEPCQSPILSTPIVGKNCLPNSRLEGVNRDTSSIGIQAFGEHCKSQILPDNTHSPPVQPVLNSTTEVTRPESPTCVQETLTSAADVDESCSGKQPASIREKRSTFSLEETVNDSNLLRSAYLLDASMQNTEKPNEQSSSSSEDFTQTAGPIPGQFPIRRGKSTLDFERLEALTRNSSVLMESNPRKKYNFSHISIDSDSESTPVKTTLHKRSKTNLNMGRGKKSVTFGDQSIVIISDSDTSFDIRQSPTDTRSNCTIETMTTGDKQRVTRVTFRDQEKRTPIRNSKRVDTTPFAKKITNTSLTDIINNTPTAANCSTASSIFSRTPTRTRMPNFSKIHQTLYDRMENVKEHSQRKADRAKMLLSGKKVCSIAHANNKISPKKAATKKQQCSKLPVRCIPKLDKKPEPPQKTAVAKTVFGFQVKTVPKMQKEELRAAANKIRVPRQIRAETRGQLAGVRTNRRFELLMKMRGYN